MNYIIGLAVPVFEFFDMFLLRFVFRKTRYICIIPRKVREYTTYAHIGVFIFVYDDHASLFLC